MTYKRISFFLIALSTLLFVAAMVLNVFKPDTSKLKERYTEEIKERTNREISLLEKEMSTVLEKVGSDMELNFTALSTNSTYPYFVFDQGELTYWSSYHFVPLYHYLAGDYKFKFIRLSEGDFLVRKYVVGTEGDYLEYYSLIPLYTRRKIENEFVRSGYHESIFKDKGVRLVNRELGPTTRSIKRGDSVLFLIDFDEQLIAGTNFHQVLMVIILSLAMLCFVIGVICYAVHLGKSGRESIGLALLAFFLLGLRALMLHFDFPRDIIPFDLFGPGYFALSKINPSLGDLLINLIFLLVLVGYALRFYRGILLIEKAKSSFSSFKIAITAILFLLSFLILYVHFHLFRAIDYDSQWILDITNNIDFPAVKLVAILIFVITAVMYFMTSHMIFRIAVYFFGNGNFKPLIISFSLATIGFVALAMLMGWSYNAVAIVNILYFTAVYVIKLSDHLQKLSYMTFIYYFTGAIACAAIGAIAIYDAETTKQRVDKREFGNELLVENDIWAEFQLNQISDKIENDVFIKNRMYNPLSSKKAVVQKIKQIYLNNYFDKYDVNIYLFNSIGKAMAPNQDLPNYHEINATFDHETFRTEYDGLFLENRITSNILKKYLTMIPIHHYDLDVGFIIIDLQLKKVIPNSIYPRLLIDRRYVQPFSSKEYNYAILSENKLLYNAGTFNYLKDFSEIDLKNRQLRKEGINYAGYHHLAVDGEDDNLIIVSAKEYPLISVLSNFSFLFIVLIFFILALVTCSSIAMGMKMQHVNLSYSSKIQLYLNLAFFIPLIVVSIIILSVISSSYSDEVNDQYFQRAERIAQNISNSLNEYLNDDIDRDALNDELFQIAKNTESDVNLFDVSGNLVSSSQSVIYENNLLSEKINPAAIFGVKEQNNNQILVEEYIGNLPYKTTYAGIRSFQTGQLIGILGLPFFDSEEQLNDRIIDVMSTMMNIFALIFILFLIISFFASKTLTAPLQYITQKLKKTSLTGYNEPLSWRGEDEIGLMIGAYNRMLENLEESKLALSRSEKESAWREMAKQVAHEIKNPLTPMKLTLQHIKRLLSGTDRDPKQFDKPIDGLLYQIDTLSDIATSFSSFAKMPIPKMERFELASLFHQTIELYRNHEHKNVESVVEPGDYFVKGDGQMIGRILSNLLINGLQSVPEDRAPKIQAFLSKNQNKKAIIEVRDNGSGIPEEIKNKVFIHNFSTKSTGSGIGLAIAKRGIEHAGGTIWFETEIGIGTSFFIELPLVD